MYIYGTRSPWITYE